MYYHTFNDATSISVCIASDIRIMNGKGRGRKEALPNLRYYSEIRMKGLRKTTRNHTTAGLRVWSREIPDTKWDCFHSSWSSGPCLLLPVLHDIKKFTLSFHRIRWPRFQNSNEKGIFFLLVLITASGMEDAGTFSIAYSALNWSNALAEETSSRL
jgi:hypothetical protein